MKKIAINGLRGNGSNLIKKLREDLINKKLVTTIGAYAYIERDYLTPKDD